MNSLLSLILVLSPSFTMAAAKSTSETANLKLNGHELTITYSAPSVRNRAGHIFDPKGLISHDPNYPIWRAGANGATVFHTDVDLAFDGLSLPKGDYTLFVDIKNPDKWVLIINKETGQWGLKYNSAKDVGHVAMEMSKPDTTIEKLKYDLTGSDKKGAIQLGWENHLAKVSFTTK